jgi:hypothetical protein
LSTISYMRECISEPMNPSPLFIIRNNFPFTLSLFSFSFIINLENKKHFLYCISQTKTLQPYHLLFIIALHITLVCIFPSCHKHIFWRHCWGLKKKKFPRQLRASHQNIFWRRCICIFTFSFVYLYTPCVWQPLGEVEDTKQIYLFCRLFEEGQEDSLYTQFPESSI